MRSVCVISMAQIYEKPIRELLVDFSKLQMSGNNTNFTARSAVQWFRTNYPKVKEPSVRAHLRKMSTNVRQRLYWKPKDRDNVFFALGSGRYRLYDEAHDPPPIMSEDDISSTVHDGRYLSDDEKIFDSDDEIVGKISTEFAYEQDLQNYLVRNLHLIESGLSLYEDEGINGVEYPAGGRYIDILAVDKEGALVVIELKVSKGHDRVIGQILRYIGWIKQNLADDGQAVRGIIIAKDISEDLSLACTQVQGISLREYSITFSLNEVSNN